MKALISTLLILWTICLQSQSTIFVCTLNQEIYSIDPSNCVATFEGTINITGGSSNGTNLFDIAIHPETGEMYAIDDLDNFVYVDLLADEAIVIAENNGNPLYQGMLFVAMTFGPDGTLYASTQTDDHLYSIDVATGELSDLGSMGTGLLSTGDLTFFEGEMYLTAFEDFQDGTYLVQINLEDIGSSTVLGFVEDLDIVFGVTSSLAFNGCNSSLFLFDDNDIYLINGDNLLENELLCENITSATIGGAASFTETVQAIDCNDDNCLTSDEFDSSTCECINEPIAPPVCDDSDCNTIDSFDPDNCECIFEPIQPGSCDDSDCSTSDSYDDQICDCVHEPIAPPICDDGDCNTVDSFDPENCDCIFDPIQPGSCDDGDCTTSDSYDDQICDCVHEPIAPPVCDDGDCNTVDTYDTDLCECIFEALQPDSCDDGDCSTMDSYDDQICDCVHEAIAPPICDDGDCSTEDSYNESTCECEYVDLPAENCDDGNSCNGLEFWDGCHCEADPYQACSESISLACDDDNPCTENDLEWVDACDNSVVCIPCEGILLDCSSNAIVQACDDGLANTENDQETILECDGSICQPCSGTAIPVTIDLLFPTAFTPNGDGNNDSYGAILLEGPKEPIASYQMLIYNRWGQLIHQASTLDQRWDGIHEGRLAPIGVYVYYVNAQGQSGVEYEWKGNFTLIR